MCQTMTAISFDEEEKSENDEAAEWTGVRRILWGGGGVTLYCNIALQFWWFTGFTGEGGGNPSLPSIKLLSLFRHTEVDIKGSGYPSMQEESKRVVNPGH